MFALSVAQSFIWPPGECFTDGKSPETLGLVGLTNCARDSGIGDCPSCVRIIPASCNFYFLQYYLAYNCIVSLRPFLFSNHGVISSFCLARHHVA